MSTISEELGNFVHEEGKNPWIEIHRVEEKVEDGDEPSWRRVTRVMNIEGIGCVLHTYTQYEEELSESSVLVPGAVYDSVSNSIKKI